jgi:hypothetical protein
LRALLRPIGEPGRCHAPLRAAFAIVFSSCPLDTQIV